MANEITYTGSITASKGGVSLSSGPLSQALTMTGSNMVLETQTIGTTAELISKGDIGTVGCLLVKNLDATNYIDIALDSGMTNKFAKLMPGDFLLIPTGGVLPYAKANTAACQVLAVVLEA